MKTTSLSFPRARFIARRTDDKLSAVQTCWNHRIKGSCHHSHSSRRGLADRRQRRSMSPPFGRRLGECCREDTGRLGFCPSAGEPSREQRGTGRSGQ
ncbi:hypothetical protein KUCAC02_034057 [Chaenocephalus aceratus]|nr:hypothetical protein KUCAC02_034057 [Chaenocephalus aceratus]